MGSMQWGGKACEVCAYWKPPKKDDDSPASGECHRHAPRPLVLYAEWADQEVRDLDVGGEKAVQPTVLWPRTWAPDCCGDFSEKQDYRSE